MYEHVKDYIALTDCEDGYLYKIYSRNLKLGVFVKSVNGFIGIRTKFRSRYLFTEYHWDTGPPYGTVKPYAKLEKVPDKFTLQETLGTKCSNCSVPVDFFDDGRKWRHLEETSCDDVSPRSISNKLLFEYLDKNLEKHDLD